MFSILFENHLNLFKGSSTLAFLNDLCVEVVLNISFVNIGFHYKRFGPP